MERRGVARPAPSGSGPVGGGPGHHGSRTLQQSCSRLQRASKSLERDMLQHTNPWFKR